LVGGGATAFALSMEVFILVIGYLILNLAYTLKLKHVAIIGITIIASGFVIRLLVVAEATQVYLSAWIIVMTFLLA
jgi:decaprenyl-phosphate phosphoribosyltransferase